MRMIRIFHSELSPSMVLSQSASRHIKVLRLSLGDVIRIFDGKGEEFEAKIVEFTKKNEVVVECINKIAAQAESPLQIHLGQGLARGEKMDYIIQKAVELGVHSITPLYTSYSEVHLSSERLPKRMMHWEGVIASACEQSGRSILPTLYEPMALSQWLKQRHEKQRMLLHPHTSHSFSTENIAVSSAAVLVGPEGGFSEEEVNLAAAEGFQAIKLGPRILRTETAALVILSILQFQQGDLK